MEKNIIFLDIDGPIAPMSYHNTHEEIPYIKSIQPEKIELLKKILEKHPSFKIVISSDWRDSLTKEQLTEVFSHYQLPIFDVVKPHVSKEEAIEHYLKENTVDCFVIIDDDKIFDIDHDYSWNQIKPSLYHGLLPMHLEMFDEIVSEHLPF